MKISTKGRYGLRILLDLALHSGEKLRLIRDIAQSQQISEKYISRLIIDLRRAGMVKSVRGSKGGYELAKAPQEITLLDVVEVMEGALSIVDCVREPGQCSRNQGCATREIWRKLNAEIRDAMQKVTLQEIIEFYQKQDNTTGNWDYCI